MFIRVLTGGIIWAVYTVSYIQLVRPCLSSNKLITAELYVNFCLLAVRSLYTRSAFDHRFLAMALCPVLLPLLKAFADIIFSLFVHSICNMSPVNNAAVGAGCDLRLLPLYSADEYIPRWSKCPDARRFASLQVWSM